MVKMKQLVSIKLLLKAKMPKEVEKKCLQELKKLKNMSPMSAEATVVRNYLRLDDRTSMAQEK